MVSCQGCWNQDLGTTSSLAFGGHLGGPQFLLQQGLDLLFRMFAAQIVGVLLRFVDLIDDMIRLSRLSRKGFDLASLFHLSLKRKLKPETYLHTGFRSPDKQLQKGSRSYKQEKPEMPQRQPKTPKKNKRQRILKIHNGCGSKTRYTPPKQNGLLSSEKNMKTPKLQTCFFCSDAFGGFSFDPSTK